MTFPSLFTCSSYGKQKRARLSRVEEATGIADDTVIISVVVCEVRNGNLVGVRRVRVTLPADALQVSNVLRAACEAAHICQPSLLLDANRCLMGDGPRMLGKSFAFHRLSQRKSEVHFPGVKLTAVTGRHFSFLLNSASCVPEIFSFAVQRRN